MIFPITVVGQCDHGNSAYRGIKKIRIKKITLVRVRILILNMRHGIEEILLSEDMWVLKWACYLLALVGLFRCLILVYRTLCFTLRHCCRCRWSLLKKYSEAGNPKSTWAVVTGGSDGIGLEFCRKFA